VIVSRVYRLSAATIAPVTTTTAVVYAESDGRCSERGGDCGLLNSRQPSSTEVRMRRIGLAVVLAFFLTIAALAVEAHSWQ
jgi:hypothetical protein